MTTCQEMRGGRGRGGGRSSGRAEKRRENGKKQAPFRVNGIQKPSPIIFACHASETDLIKTT